MTEYALTKDGATIADVRSFAERPPDPIGKGWHWLPLTVTEIAHDQDGYDTVDVPGDTATRYTPAVPPQTVFSFEGFRARLYAGLTEVEIGAIRTAIKDDAEALDWAFEAASDNRIDITSPTTAALLDKLIAAGLITTAHKANVIDPGWNPA